MPNTPLHPLADYVWRSRYRYCPAGQPAERTLQDTFARVAAAVAAVESDPAAWTPRFQALLAGGGFLPGGRILAGAGTPLPTTLLNCFVMGPIEDSIAGVFDALKEGELALQQGGGVGSEFSALGPGGARAAIAVSGGGDSVALMALWDAACAAVTAGLARGGAMMGTLRMDHPDIEGFIAAKATPGTLERFNLSVAVPDRFMAALDADEPWTLRFPPGEARPGDPGRQVPAAPLWRSLGAAAGAMAEPGAVFIDTVNRGNNRRWREQLRATNPCGEAPLPPYGACDLGSLNLVAFVRGPFTPAACLDLEALGTAATLAVRFLDDVLDIARYPLPRQREAALATRRIGLGVTGLADALAMLGLRYDRAEARACAALAVERIKRAAYAASVALAREKGAFPAWQREPFMASPFVGRLDGGLRDAIASHGLRNSHLLAIAPAGSISLLAGNVSAGIEPIVGRVQRRLLRQPDGSELDCVAPDAAWALFERGGRRDGDGAFIEAADVGPREQLLMQAALQPHVDGAISKTVLLPAAGDADAGEVFRSALGLGLKGCTVYRLGTARGSVFGCARCVPD